MLKFSFQSSNVNIWHWCHIKKWANNSLHSFFYFLITLPRAARKSIWIFLKIFNEYITFQNFIRYYHSYVDKIWSQFEKYNSCSHIQNLINLTRLTSYNLIFNTNYVLQTRNFYSMFAINISIFKLISNVINKITIAISDYNTRETPESFVSYYIRKSIPWSHIQIISSVWIQIKYLFVL